MVDRVSYGACCRINISPLLTLSPLGVSYLRRCRFGNVSSQSLHRKVLSVFSRSVQGLDTSACGFDCRRVPSLISVCGKERMTILSSSSDG